jgi:glycosidase
MPNVIFLKQVLKIMKQQVFPVPAAMVILFCCFSCSPKYTPIVNTGAGSTSFAHPSWSAQSNIYEVNLRQYSEEGTFKEFEKSLPRLREMGVDILWFMPITPIGLEDRKENASQLGSYYAVKDYKGINPEFGTLGDWKELVARAHGLGMKVITDWVANHTSPDNPWMKNHPAFYARDKDGKVISPFDWTDTRKLDYTNAELRDSMTDVMKWWITQTGIDGFRCDVADGPPVDYWKDCIARLKKIKDVFMLAESENPGLHYAGFDETYTWSVMSAMEDVYQGKKKLKGFDSLLDHNIAVFPQNAYRMFFTANHDENSWNGTEMEKYGDACKAFAVFTQTMYQSVPLIYSGQEIPNERRLKFFVKDPIRWDKYDMAPFYSTLLHLRKKDEALAAGAGYKKVITANDDAIFAYLRQKGKHKVLVVLNLSGEPQSFTIKQDDVYGKVVDVFSGAKEKLFDHYVYSMDPWGYAVYEYK